MGSSIVLILVFLILFLIQTICFVFCSILQYKSYLLMYETDRKAEKFREWQKWFANEKRAREYLKECDNE